MTLALIHTSPVLIPTFNALLSQYLPDVTRFHVVDESLIQNTIRSGRLEEITFRRVAGYVQLAREGGADAVLVTCSSIGPAVSAAKGQFDFPVLRIDEAMAERAVASGTKIGVLATLNTTLEPTIALVRDTASRSGREIAVEAHLCDGAFAAVLRGDTETHDRMVLEGMKALLAGNDVVVLAQASMARVIPQLPDDLRTKPVLASPELAMQRTAEVLRTLTRTEA